jgi:predicted MFS family arabinose efflux permease
MRLPRRTRIVDVDDAKSLGARHLPHSRRSWAESGAYRVVNYGVRPIGSLLAGALGETIGLRPTLWIAAGGATLAFLWLLPSPLPSLRELPEQAA